MNKNTKEVVWRALALTGVVVAIFVIAIAIQRAGFGGILSIMGSIVAVLGFALTVLWDRIRPQTGDRMTEQAADREVPHQAALPSQWDREISTEEYAQHIKQSPDWRGAGTRNYSNRTVRIARALKRGLEYLPISERGLQWGQRGVFALGVLSYLWLVLIIGRSFDEIFRGILPETLQSVIYAVQAPTIFAQTLVEFIPLIVPVVILMAVILGGDLKSKSTCEKCGESFALKNEGTYYHRDAKTPKTETKDGEQYSWNEYEGAQLLRCVHEDCREYNFRETEWTDESFWR